ncbi:hypothetical protein BR93DRAFT_932774 [Coniochaeta sp. PMI_546]|nr:hypothetical protein BR93DRAFT_932774 [Coniochaeta sp. PMI_546]
MGSFLYGKARYVQHQQIIISLRFSKAKNEIGSMRYLSSNGFLPAIRTLRFIEVVDDEATSYQFSTPSYTLIGQVTGLRDIHLDAFCDPVPVSVLENLKQRIRVRLHVSVTTFSEQTTAIAASEAARGLPTLELCAEYCGLGLSNDERLPPFNEVVLLEYPWSRDGSSAFPWAVKRHPVQEKKSRKTTGRAIMTEPVYAD